MTGLALPIKRVARPALRVRQRMSDQKAILHPLTYKPPLAGVEFAATRTPGGVVGCCGPPGAKRAASCEFDMGGFYAQAHSDVPVSSARSITFGAYGLPAAFLVRDVLPDCR